jgi:hypothetical protein
MTIQAIPTEYNGTKYRSRTEARWAVFFDISRIPVRYEAEGFQTESGWYLPDFELTGATRKTFFEVKPERPADHEIAVLAALAKGAEAHAFVACGPPQSGCAILKVFADGSQAQWHFGRDQQHLISFLAASPPSGIILSIRHDVVPANFHSYGAGSELTKAAQHRFRLFDEGRPVRGTRDRRDWKQREREILNARTADLRGRK